MASNREPKGCIVSATVLFKLAHNSSIGSSPENKEAKLLTMNNPFFLFITRALSGLWMLAVSITTT